ncbi:alpha/beta fold hydrolase [Pseudoduganella sp. DS3]|uniref:Alpha/beta fold hydrolase n=1 Tax=Pseudoduganella guangdongensis TaxID=2692179 RepID=A0A6N9HC74_9BURK|nr:alpha/beta hydrolase [Pseudoduganella guangdongensis]MYN01161.1 alpha/beta fold hydrolase [Pseudoduganella guangdongensis]
MKQLKRLYQAVTCAAIIGGASGGALAKPPVTVILVHGAFADSSSWNAVIPTLQQQGVRVVSAANPLRSLDGDIASVRQLVRATPGSVVLVGHSYGGAVISGAATSQANVKALVYVAAFAPDKGETALELSGRFPGSSLGGALGQPVSTPEGSKDLYIDQAKFHGQFAADVGPAVASLMAATQRPIAEAALTQGAGEPAWKVLPSWHIYGTGDKNIPAAAMSFMAKRAHAKKIVEVPGASHVVMVSHADEVARIILEAAASVR